MTNPQDHALRRFIGDGLVAVGSLITALSGLCTTGVLVFVAVPTAFSDGFVALLSMVPWVLVFGGAPIVIGVGLILWGRRLNGVHRPAQA